MDGSPDLISNVTFSEARKGYDPDEVHNYLLEVEDQVGTLKDMTRTAIERAEAAEARVAEVRRGTGELEQRVAAAQQRAAEAERRLARAEAARSEADQTAEAAGILAMAQKTADAALADANARAAEVTRDADQRAAERLEEAMARADELVAAARREADATREAELGAMHDELERLTAVRGELQRDIDLLEGFLERRRAMLRETIDQLGSVIDDPERLRLGSPPPVSDIVVPERPQPSATAADGEGDEPVGSISAEADEPASPEAAAAVPLVPSPDAAGASGVEDLSLAGGEGPGEDAGARVATSGDDVPAPEAADEPAAEDQDDEYEDEDEDEYEVDELAEAEADDEEPEGDDEPWYQDDSAGDDEPRGIPVVTVEDLGEPTQAVPVAELFGDGGEGEGERKEGSRLFPDEDDSSFGHLDDEEDAAMRAFFEGDGDGPDSRPRWGFGRKR